jgi:tetratricopeptide (TPR) repeat protein
MRSSWPVYARSVFFFAGALLAESDEWERLMRSGQSLERAGNYREAAVSFRDAERIAQKSELRDRRLMLALNSLALAYKEMGRFSEAERCLRRALTSFDKAKDRNHPDRALLLTNLSLLYQEEGKAAKSEQLLTEAIAIDTAVLPPGDSRLLLAHAAMAELVLMQARYSEADKQLQESLAAFEKQPDRWKREIGTLRGDLGVVRESQGRDEEAVQLFEQSIAMLEEATSRSHPILLRSLVNLASLNAARGRASDADSAFRRAIAIAEDHLGTEHPRYLNILMRYAAFLRANGQKNEAKALEARSKALLQQSARREGSALVLDASAFGPK